MAESTAVLRDHFGPDFDLDRFLEEERVHIEALFAEGVALKAGVVELLDFLDTLGLPRAIATSSSHDSVDAHLGHHGLLDRFHAVIAREDVRAASPPPTPSSPPPRPWASRQRTAWRWRTATTASAPPMARG